MGEFELGHIIAQNHTIARYRKTTTALSVSEKETGKDRDEKKMKDACREFESLFVYQMLKEMRATVPKTGLFGGGRAEEVFTSMLDEQLSRELSREKGIGLSGLLLHQLNQVKNNRE